MKTEPGTGNVVRNQEVVKVWDLADYQAAAEDPSNHHDHRSIRPEHHPGGARTTPTIKEMRESSWQGRQDSTTGKAPTAGMSTHFKQRVPSWPQGKQGVAALYPTIPGTRTMVKHGKVMETELKTVVSRDFFDAVNGFFSWLNREDPGVDHLCEFLVLIHGFKFKALDHPTQPPPPKDGCGAYGPWTEALVRDAMVRFRLGDEECLRKGLEPHPNAPNEILQGVNETLLSHCLKPSFCTL